MANKTLTLPVLGECQLSLPKRISARLLLASAYGQEQERGDHGRCGLVFAAALGLCWTGTHPDGSQMRAPMVGRVQPVRLPEFNISTDRIVPYGAQVLDVLIGLYGMPYTAALWSDLRTVLEWVVLSIPREQEVADRVNFTSQSVDSMIGN